MGVSNESEQNPLFCVMTEMIVAQRTSTYKDAETPFRAITKLESHVKTPQCESHRNYASNSQFGT